GDAAVGDRARRVSGSHRHAGVVGVLAVDPGGRDYAGGELSSASAAGGLRAFGRCTNAVRSERGLVHFTGQDACASSLPRARESSIGKTPCGTFPSTTPMFFSCGTSDSV